MQQRVPGHHPFFREAESQARLIRERADQIAIELHGIGLAVAKALDDTLETGYQIERLGDAGPDWKTSGDLFRLAIKLAPNYDPLERTIFATVKPIPTGKGIVFLFNFEDPRSNAKVGGDWTAANSLAPWFREFMKQLYSKTLTQNEELVSLAHKSYQAQTRRQGATKQEG
jgi:hypothetical protein